MYQHSAFPRRAHLRLAVRLCTFIATATLLLPIAAMAGGIELDSREYKLMLKPEKFTTVEPQQAVERFITEQLVPALREQWNSDAAAELGGRGMQIGERRIIRFWDSGDCQLYRHGFAWRGRTEINEDGKRADELEVTLKFRSPDAFLAAGMPLTAKDGARKVDSKLEEDLGPVAVRSGPDGATPRSARSQFSRSTTQTITSDQVPTTLAGVKAFFPSFEEELRAVAGRVDISAPLDPSPEYREIVYKSTKLDITNDLKARFALTLWYRGAENQNQPALVEISFKYEAKNGNVPNEASRRALALLLTMQDLPWANPAAPTKTALVACDAAS